MSKFLRTLFGILLIPAAIGTGQAFYQNISNISIFSDSLHIIERGILSYLLMHTFIFKPIYIYVLGHELVHVLATWVCGGSVVAFHVTPSGGNVVTSKTNFFIELSPYFVPLYTILLGLCFWLFQLSGNGSVKASGVFLFLVGFTLAFHFVMTSEALRLQQDDVMKSGIIFSFVIIFISNLIIVSGVFAPVFSSISFTEFFKDSVSGSGELYTTIYEGILQFIERNKFW